MRPYKVQVHYGARTPARLTVLARSERSAEQHARRFARQHRVRPVLVNIVGGSR